jgi:hypothetical protein
MPSRWRWQKKQMDGRCRQKEMGSRHLRKQEMIAATES